MDLQLPQYRNLHRLITAPFAARNELQIVMEPGDEIAQLSADIIVDSELAPDGQIEALAISIDISNGQKIKWAPPEITSLRLKESKDGTLRAMRGNDCVTVCFEPADEWTPKRGIHFTCDVWEAMRPGGMEPYAWSELTIRLNLLTSCNGTLVLTLDTPVAASPRSTQGNFVLAYPSMIQKQRRQTLLYFSDGASATLRYRFGEIEAGDLPWAVLFKSTLALAVVAVLVWIPNVLGPDVDQSKNILLLVTAVGSYAVYINDLLARGMRVEIYKTIRRSLTLVALACGLIVTTMYVWIIYIFLTAGQAPVNSSALPGFPQHIKIATLVAVIAAIIVTALGMCAHALGVWHGYRCDLSGCSHRFLIRTGRRECKYTGRVPCEQHTKAICAACPHYADLASGLLDSEHKYCASTLPCVQELRSPWSNA